jgi:hypothetical protein
LARLPPSIAIPMVDVLKCLLHIVNPLFALTQWKELIDLKKESESVGDDEEGSILKKGTFNYEFLIL